MFKKRLQPPGQAPGAPQSGTQPDFPLSSQRKGPKKEGLAGVLSPRQKFEEEVTLDLNTTQTNQEREYKEFILFEIKTESTFIINECNYHSAQLAAAASILLFAGTGNDQPVTLALLVYLLLGIVFRIKGRFKRMRTGGKHMLVRIGLQILSLLVTASLLMSGEDLIVRVCIPVFVLISILEVVLEFLDFSDTIDEVFSIKIVVCTL